MSEATSAAAALAVVAQGIHLGGLAVGTDVAWYGDIVAGGAHRVAADGSVSHWLPERRWIGGMYRNSDGAALLGGTGGIVWVDPATGRSGTLLAEVDGQPLPGANEMCTDGAGGIYFGTVDLPSIERAVPPSPSGLFHLGADGTARQLCDGLVFTNGLELSLDGRTLFHNESFVGVFAYPLLPGGELGERRMIVEKEDCDGMAIDVAGNLWISGFSSNEVLCMTPDGEVLHRVHVPGGGVSNVCFGSPGGRDLYVTATAPGASDDLKAGRPLTKEDSFLYRTASPVAGRIAPPSRFALT